MVASQLAGAISPEFAVSDRLKCAIVVALVEWSWKDGAISELHECSRRNQKKKYKKEQNA